MATVYTKTDNYGLNLYGDNDPADLRDGYNGSMRTIDTTMETHLNRIESVESRETHDEEVVKALLGDNTVDNATAAKTKWDKAGTDATAAASKADNNMAILTALGSNTTAAATANKSKWDKAATDATDNKAALTALGADSTAAATANKSKWDKAATDATDNKAALTTLGADSTATAAANKSKWDKAATDATAALNAVNTPDKLKDYVVVLGDSWVNGWHDGADHVDQSPALAIKNKLNPRRFYYKGSSGGGFVANSGNGTFSDVWQSVPDKNSVSAVIVIGGQNDATSMKEGHTDELAIFSKARDLINAIHKDAPMARIHVCPMVLAVGATLTQGDHDVKRADRVAVYKALTLNIKDCGFDYVRVHEGGYRIGVVAEQAEGQGSAGDDVHLNAAGYVLAGYWIAHCVAADCDLWPTRYGDPDKSQINAKWNWFNIYECNGWLHIGYRCEYTTKPANGNRICKLPKWAKIGNPQYYPAFDAKSFVAVAGDEITIQGCDGMGNTGVIAGDYTIPAGF